MKSKVKVYKLPELCFKKKGCIFGYFYYYNNLFVLTCEHCH